MLVLILLTYLILCSILILMITKDIFYPSSVSTIMLVIVTFFATINTHNWDYTMSVTAFYILFFTALAFNLGSLMALKCSHGNRRSFSNNTELFFSNIFLIILLGLSIILTCINIYKSAPMIFHNANYHLQDIIIAMKQAITNNTIGAIAKLAFRFNQIFLYFFLYSLVYDIINKKNKKQRLLKFLVLIPANVMYFFNDSRLMFIIEFIFVLSTAYILLMYRGNWKKKYNLKFFIIGLISLCFVFWGFYFLGLISTRFAKGSSILNWISIYVGSPLYGLELFLKNFTLSDLEYGRNSFNNLFRLFHYLGISIEFSNVTWDEFYAVGNHYSNIYSLKSSLLDFGYIGTYVSEFFLGFIISRIYINIKYNNYKSMAFMIIFYCQFVYVLLFQWIDASPYIIFLSTTTLINIIIMYFIYIKVIVKKTNKLRR